MFSNWIQFEQKKPYEMLNLYGQNDRFDFNYGVLE